MRYRLRTLVWWTIVVPPALALLWAIFRGEYIQPVLLAAAMYAIVAKTLYWLWN